MLDNWWIFTNYRTGKKIKMQFMNYSLNFIFSNHENPVGSYIVSIVRATEHIWPHLQNFHFLKARRKVRHPLIESCHLRHLFQATFSRSHLKYLCGTVWELFELSFQTTVFKRTLKCCLHLNATQLLIRDISTFALSLQSLTSFPTCDEEKINLGIYVSHTQKEFLFLF